MREGIANGAGSFNDVDSEALYADTVSWTTETQITPGTSPAMSVPDDDLTCRQIITFLWRLKGTSDPFAMGVDLPSTMQG